MLKQRIILSLWWLLAIAVAGLLIAAVQHKKSSLCNDIKVEIEDNEGHVFIDENEIEDKLNINGAYKGERTSNINLRTLETILKNQPWIKGAELYFDNNQVLQVKIKEREPVARIFAAGSSFYIDSAGTRLPLSKDYTAHVPVFTSFTSDKKMLSSPDSLLLDDVKNIANYIQKDSFWNAQISQVVITPKSTFEIIPVLGNQIIKLGKADSLESKFNRLYAFYKQVWAKTGFEKYETVSVEFSGQVVATRRGAPKPYVDSVLAYRIVAAMRNGDDILKDSSLQFHNIEVSQKNNSDTIKNQSAPVTFDETKTTTNNTITKQNTAVKTTVKITHNNRKK